MSLFSTVGIIMYLNCEYLPTKCKKICVRQKFHFIKKGNITTAQHTRTYVIETALI